MNDEILQTTAYSSLLLCLRCMVGCLAFLEYKILCMSSSLFSIFVFNICFPPIWQNTEKLVLQEGEYTLPKHVLSLCRLLFFSAKPNTEEVLDSLRKEAAEHSDIVILPTVTESYFNITYQTLEVLRFGAADQTATHVLKVIPLSPISTCLHFCCY